MEDKTDEPVRVIGVAERRRAWLELARLYFVCDLAPAAGELEQVLRAALKNGVDVVQLRDKRASQSELVTAARVFRRLCDAYDALFIVNDRPELALTCGADGLHLGQDDLDLDRARKLVGSDLLIGVSTHSEKQIAAARDQSICDYIGVGPVFATPTKPGYHSVGLPLVEYATKSAAMPFFAIGGIDMSNAASVVAAGGERIAILRAIAAAADPGQAARELKKILHGKVS